MAGAWSPRARRMQPTLRSLDFGQGIRRRRSAVPKQIGVMLRELLVHTSRHFRPRALGCGTFGNLAPSEIFYRFLVHLAPPRSVCLHRFLVQYWVNGRSGQ